MASPARRAVNALIRPPRTNYNLAELPLYLKVDDHMNFGRFPVTFRNSRGQNLVGSIYHSMSVSPLAGGPCVIYLHGNASSQLEGQFLVPNLCPHGVFLFCFDFAGCGHSGGDYVSLGWYERQDTELLIEVLSKSFKFGPFIVWGRSMGATTSLLVEHPKLVGRVSDSAFTSIPDMCAAIAASVHLPHFFVTAANWYLQKKVLKAASFDIAMVAPVAVNHPKEVPAVFGHSEKDQFIPFDQCRQLYEHYQSDRKYIMMLPGGHNTRRPPDWLQLGVTFCFEQFALAIPNPQIYTSRALQKSDAHFENFQEMVAHSQLPDDSEPLPSEGEFILQLPDDASPLIAGIEKVDEQDE
jgi:pimeloyl-ACP methyl ester carboxylesterase